MKDQNVPRVIISGWRGWTNETPIKATLKQVQQIYGTNTILVHGDNKKGVDAIAEKIWTDMGGKTERYPADWNNHKKGAGPIRNQQMLDKGADLVILFASEQSKGTFDMLKRAKAAKCDLWLHVVCDIKQI